MGAEERPKRRRARKPLSSRDGLQKSRALALKTASRQARTSGHFSFWRNFTTKTSLYAYFPYIIYVDNVDITVYYRFH